MAATGFRTVHVKGDRLVVHWQRREWSPAPGTSTFQVGDRVWVGTRSDGDLTVLGAHVETWTARAAS